ncbi:glutathione S-transferase [Cycloclasticus sp. P1]|uniref:glutathione S-transferase n=1 Tax=Cycloclasticus sp. (strain P1) TaxID=385025 RepID=UPI00059C7CC6|nr:glutathione S-transferase [Cycloclasticus sp. P1]
MTSTANTPILYSFRRCPYAMRARLAIKHAGIKVILREVVLRNKPPAMLAISPKGTVPVLQLPTGEVIDESWEIVHWATSINDSQSLRGSSARVLDANRLVSLNDNEFKQHLDHYKYADRFPDFSAEHYRTQAEAFLSLLDQRLAAHSFLLDDEPSIADIGIFPFIRQFAHVDINWFKQTPYPYLQRWFEHFLSSELFTSIMNKYPAWEEGQDTLLF